MGCGLREKEMERRGVFAIGGNFKINVETSIYLNNKLVNLHLGQIEAS